MSEVFSVKQMEAMHDAMKKIISKIITPMKLVLTEQEFLEGFIYPDHIPKLQEATQLTGIVAVGGGHDFTAHSASGEELSMVRHSDFQARIMFPIYVKKGLQPDAPALLRERFNDWIANRLLLSNAMRDVHGALDYLNDTCSNARVIRTLLPCLPLIVSMMYYNDNIGKVEGSVKAADKIARATGSGGLPMLSREIKQRLQESSSIVTSHFALMNEQHSPVAPAYGFTCWLATRSTSRPILGRCYEAY